MLDVKKRNKNKDLIANKNADGTETERNIKTNGTNLISKQNISLRVISRTVVIFSLIIVVYFTSKNENIETFAKQSELLPGKGLIIECSPDYEKEVRKYEGCSPKECKRFVTDKVISVKEAEELLVIAKKGLKLGGSSGGASILDLHSGALSKEQYFVNIYKIDESKNLFSKNDFNVYKIIKEKIKNAVAYHFGVRNPNSIYLTHPTFFSEITNRKAITLHDEYWHPHVDKETYKSFHYTTLLYLGDYNTDFKGGRFVFVDEKINSTIEPRKARLSIFTSGAENLHYVEKVTFGIRYAMTISFTCDKQYAIEDPSPNKYWN